MYHCWPIPCPIKEVAPRSLPDVYRMILEQRQEQLRQTLATLAAPGGFPALVHCTAGKDRTGFIVALLLGLVGVPAATILKTTPSARSIWWDVPGGGASTCGEQRYLLGMVPTSGHLPA